MSKRDWWLGAFVVLVALLAHAALPRYEWLTVSPRVVLRGDRWTGTVSVGTVTPESENRFVVTFAAPTG